ncbi:MAG: murein L,D-transpeptidase [Acidobacteriota bacterium]
MAPSSELRQILSVGLIPGLSSSDFQDLRAGVSSLYEQTGFLPLWIEVGKLTPKGQAILDALAKGSAKGLNPQDYDADLLAEWARRLQAAPDDDPLAIAKLDIAMTVDLMRYASALHQGRVDPREVHFAIGSKDRLDPAAFVREYLDTTQSLSDLLARLEPPFSGYRKTLAALVRYHQLSAQEAAQMPARPRLPLRRGEKYVDLPAFAARLALLGDLAPQTEGTGEVYEGPVLEAVKRFQVRHGIAGTGIVDLATWRALTIPLSQRHEQLALALERWRWIPAAVRPAIVVNIPEFELRAYDENRQLVLRMHVIVGKAYRHKTPIFEDNLESVIVRPWWNVPFSIQRGEMVPLIRRNPDYLAKNDLQIVDEKSRPVSWNPQDPPIDRLASGDLRLRQRPGPENSLGLLKFDFPNDYSVYMHGTPARQLFSRARRDFSHGCIRVEDPESLAAWVLRDHPAWTREKIAAACNGETTVRIPLRQPLAVLVLYGTAIVEDSGEVRFFDDIYGYDAELRAALAAKKRASSGS